MCDAASLLSTQHLNGLLHLCGCRHRRHRCCCCPTQVKTQRALNDYRKSAFPHYKDEITRLRYIGVVSANRLKDARAHLGPDVPISCVDTVEDLKKLLEYADTNRWGCCCWGPGHRALVALGSGWRTDSKDGFDAQVCLWQE